MKVGLFSDTHWGFKNSSSHIFDYFESFYRDVFFPTLEKNNIDTVIHLGDAFDNRRSIDLQSLNWTKRVVLDPLRKYKVHMIVGNHDIYYKNTNEVSSPKLLLQNYQNIKVYDQCSEIDLDGNLFLLIPWINQQNYEKTFELVKTTTCKGAFGHLELHGFRISKFVTMEGGLDCDCFKTIPYLYSGHFHTRSVSRDGRIRYIGNPYEMFWSDVNDERGFCILDTDTMEITEINNPYKMFYEVLYTDNIKLSKSDLQNYKNKIVKVIVNQKDNQLKYEKFIKQLYDAGVYDLVINDTLNYSTENVEVDDNVDTLSILSSYIDSSDFISNKDRIKNIMSEIYKEASSV